MIEQCPLSVIPEEAWEAITAARLADKHGAWPVAGGWLDQAKWCVDAFRFVWGEQARWRAALQLKDI